MPARLAVLILGLLAASQLHARDRSIAPEPCMQATRAVREAYLHDAMAVPPPIAQLLVHAIDGDLPEVRQGLGFLSPSDQRRWRQAALLTAVYAGHRAEALALLEDGAAINEPAWLPGVREGLLEDVLSPRLATGLRSQPLYDHAQAYGPALVAAVGCGDAAMVGMLLEHGADASVQPPPGTAGLLTIATIQGNAAIVGMLLDHGATSCDFDHRPHPRGHATSLSSLGDRVGLPVALTGRMRCPAGRPAQH
jgi:hypothetical protein